MQLRCIVHTAEGGFLIAAKPRSEIINAKLYIINYLLIGITFMIYAFSPCHKTSVA